MRTAAELYDGLDRQLSALRSSCRAYDRGEHWEAARIATALIVLIFDKGRNVSLFTQLGIKDQATFVSTSVDDIPGNLSDWHPLVLRSHGVERVTWLPRFGSFDTQKRHLPFDSWWNETVLISRTGSEGVSEMTREELLRTLRDKDGGSHFDNSLIHITYRHFASERPTWAAIHPTPEELRSFVIEGLPHWATARQIAYEFENSLDSVGIITDPDLLNATTPEVDGPRAIYGEMQTFVTNTEEGAEAFMDRFGLQRPPK